MKKPSFLAEEFVEDFDIVLINGDVFCVVCLVFP
jgi:hypothetical protein